MNGRWVVALLLAVAGVASGAVDARVADAGPTPKPTVQISPASASPGESVRVQLDNWPQGVVTATTCGNGAKRGAQDCSLMGSQGELVGPDALTAFDLVLEAPPMPCPCVVLVSTSTNDISISSPIPLNGVASGLTTGSPTPDTPESQLVVSAEVQRGGGGWMAAFAGPAHRTLEVTIRNRGATTARTIRVEATVGRNRFSSEHAGTKHVGALAPGSQRTVSVPITISAPTWGAYTVSGHVYAGGDAVAFSTRTKTEPWGLELAVPFLLLIWAQFIRRRHREVRDEAEHRTVPEAPTPDDLEPLPPSSPRVGSEAGIGFTSSPHASTGGRQLVGTSVNGHVGATDTGGGPSRSPVARRSARDPRPEASHLSR